MKGNDSWVEAHPAWLNSTLVLSSASVSTSKERSVPIHSGGPARQRLATRLPGVSSVTAKSKVIGASGNETFISRSDPIRALGVVAPPTVYALGGVELLSGYLNIIGDLSRQGRI